MEINYTYLIGSVIAIIVAIISLMVSWKSWSARNEILKVKPEADWIESHTAGLAVSLLFGLVALGGGIYMGVGAFSPSVRRVNQSVFNRLRRK